MTIHNNNDAAERKKMHGIERIARFFSQHWQHMAKAIPNVFVKSFTHRVACKK